MVMAAALVTLATLPILPATQTDTTKLRTAVVVPIAEKTPEPHPKADRKIREPVPKKLVIERPPPEKPAPRELTPEKPAAPIPEPAPDPDRNSDKNLVRPLRAGATSVPVLPGADRKASTERRFPAAARSATTESRPRARDDRLSLSVPRLGLENVPVGDSPDQGYLDREGIMHLKKTGAPWKEGSNTVIVGHALGFLWTRTPYVFYELDQLKKGDEIVVKDQEDKAYTFRVYDRMTVRPEDFWITYPVSDKTVISL